MDSSVSLCAILFALYLSGIECNSVLAVVSFACANCGPKPRICCTGTFILPTFVLTSRTCAETCHAIDFRGTEIPLTHTYVHVHHGPHLKGIIGLDGVAIVRVSKVIHNHYVKLSPLEALSAIGFKVFIPRFFDNKTTIEPAVITLCEGSIYTDGYHICTAVNLNDRCNIKQGSPLFFNGKIIGIMGIRNIKTCNYLQTAFIAIAPFISWIQTIVSYENSAEIQETKRDYFVTTTPKKALTVTENNVNKSTATLDLGSTIYFNNTGDMIYSHEITGTDLKEVTQASLKDADEKPTTDRLQLIPVTITTYHDLTVYNHTISPHTKSILRAKAKKTTNKKYSKGFNNKKSSVTKLKPIKRKNTKLITSKKSIKSSVTSKITTVTTSSVKEIKTTPSITPASKIITSKKSSPKSANTAVFNSTAVSKTTTRKPTKITEATEEVTSTAQTDDAVMSTTLESTTIDLDKESSTQEVTSAMDWFNNNIRGKLKDNPAVLVLTTERLSAYTTEFVDLT